MIVKFESFSQGSWGENNNIFELPPPSLPMNTIGNLKRLGLGHLCLNWIPRGIAIGYPPPKNAALIRPRCHHPSWDFHPRRFTDRRLAEGRDEHRKGEAASHPSQK